MYFKYVISFLLLILLTGIATVSGQIDTEVITETVTPVINPVLTAVIDTSTSTGIDKIPAETEIPLITTPSPDSNSVTAASTPSAVTDKTPVETEIPLITTPSPDSNSITPVATVITPLPTLKVTVSDKKAASVIFYKEELFSINTALGNYSPEERASIILNRLEKVLEDVSFNPEEIKVEIKDSHPCIIYKGIIIMTLSEEDGRFEGLTDKEAADKYAQKIRDTLKTYKEEHSFKAIIFGVIYSLIATLIFIFLLTMLDKILKLIYKKINSWRGSRIFDLKIQNLVLLSGDRIVEVIVKSLKIIAFVVKLIICYIYLSAVLSFFVWTRDFGSRLLSYILSGLYIIWLKFLSYLPHMFYIVFVVAVTYYIIRFISFIFVELEKGTIEFPGFYREWAKPTYMIVRFLIIALSLVIIFPYLPGYGSPAFKGISLFLGVLFSLGSTAIVSNIVAGIILIYMNAFKIGDRVKIGDVTGDITEKTLLVTRIRTPQNVDITMPNAMILANYIINYSSASQESGLILHTTVTIGYDVPWKDVHKLLIEAALATEGILKEPSPFVFQTSLDDFYVSYELNAYTNKPNSTGSIYSTIHQNIQDKFNEKGVEIMSPHYRAMRDGNQTTIPADYLSDTYTPPVFKISQEEKSSQEIDQ